MEKIHFDRLCIIKDEYKEMGPEKLDQLVEEGRAIIEQHGEEGLYNKLKTEDEFRAAAVYFDYRIVTDEEHYEED